MKEKFTSLLLITALAALVTSSCEKHPIEDRFNQDKMVINNDLAVLSKRVKINTDNNKMQILPVDFISTPKSLKSSHVATQYQIYLRAEVDAPLYEGKTLQASHIKIVGNYAYVTYNVRGPEYLGGVDIFDVSDIRNPALISNVVFPAKDISSVDVEEKGAGNNNMVYLAGASNLDTDQLDLKTPAILERFIVNQANQFVHLDEPRSFYDLPGYAGNDVRYSSGKILATSGSDGGLSILNNGLNLSGYTSLPYSRSVDTDGDRIVVYSALDNKIKVMDMEGVIIREIVTGGMHFVDDEYLQAKSIIRLKGNLVFVAAGTGGMEVYNVTTGEKAGSLPRPVEYEDADTPLNYVTNGVSLNNNLVLVANGGSGIHIAEHYDSGEIETIGKFMFEYGSSANFVEASDNKIFVATGKGGLKILEIVPVEPTETCETLWDRIVELFPETKSIHNATHPSHDLSNMSLPGTIEITEDAPVYITFIHNGAGWHNSFGYYSYHKDNPPANVEELLALDAREIVYPYVNESANGQKRVMGERIRLGGEKVFEEGTIIGFYIVAQGWDRVLKKMVEGIHTVYTNPLFNQGGKRKHVLFLEESCLDIVLGFEDMLDGDEDFNDIILIVSNGDDVFGNQTNYAIHKEGLPVK
jgi:hypothetical protein